MGSAHGGQGTVLLVPLALSAATYGSHSALLVPRATDDLGLTAVRPRRAGLADDKLRRLLGSLVPLTEALEHMRATEQVHTPGS